MRGRPFLLAIIVLLLAATSAASWAAERHVTTPAPGTPEAVVQAALVAALGADEARAFDAYLALLHPDEVPTPFAIRSIRRYSWKRFRRQAPDYIVPGTLHAFVVTRVDPKRIDARTDACRVFLAAVARRERTQPTPVRLRRDDEGRWKITANSL